MKDEKHLTKLIENIKSGKKVQAVGLVKHDPETAALISKLVMPNMAEDFNVKKDSQHYNLDRSQLKAISDSSIERVRDNKNITELFPDIELAIQILVSSILSPKDMVNTDIIYNNTEALFPAELTNNLNTIIKDELNSHYKILDDLPVMLREALFETGSFIKAVIPENSLDEIINGNQQLSTESLSPLFNKTGKETEVVNLGILRSESTKLNSALEHIVMYNTGYGNYNPKINVKDNVDFCLEVVDNFHLLKLPLLTKVATENALSKITRPKSQLNNVDFSTLIYKSNRTSGMTDFKTIYDKNSLSRKPVGRPLVMKLPSESVIPVHLPGDETHHVGYFVLIDNDGNPVTYSSTVDTMHGLNNFNQSTQQNASLSSLLLQKAKTNLLRNDDEITIDHISKVYANIVERDLIERLKNGVYGKELAIAKQEDIYRIMLSRSLANKYTRLVYIPNTICSYIAFKYFDNGVGKSYLDDLKVLTSLRGILLFSKIMAMAKSSIALTRVNMNIDPNDPDPKKTIEIAQHEIVKMRQNYFPLGINSPIDLVDWIQRAGLEFTFEGHPGLPQTKFDFESKNIQHTQPDSDIDELLRKQTYMALGLSPEIVDNGFNQEFATTVVSNNILLSKRVLQHQKIFTIQLSEYIHKIIMNDTIIYEKLISVLKENKALLEKRLSEEDKQAMSENEEAFIHYILDRYIETLRAELPKPDETTVATQLDAFNSFQEALEKGLDSVISSEFITNDLTGEISSNIDSIKASWKAYFLRQWMVENNFLNELTDIVTADEDGNPTLDIYDINKSHIEGLMRSSIKFIKSLQPIKTAADTDLENLNVEEGSSSSDTSSDDSGSDDSGGDDFGMGGDDFGMGDTGTDEDGEEDTATDEESTDEESKV